MAEKTWGSIKGRRLRVTKLTECGAVAYGSCASLVTKGFVSVKQTPEISEGTTYEQKNASDELEVSDRSPDQLKWINAEIVLTKVDPELISFLTGQPLVLDYAGNAVGLRQNDLPFSGDVGIEVWSDLPGQACVSGAKPYGYFLLPWVKNGSLGEINVANEVANFTINARTQAGSLWGTGPYNVDAQDVGNTPGKLLTAIGANDHRDMHLTTIAPPAVTAGCVALAAP